VVVLLQLQQAAVVVVVVVDHPIDVLTAGGASSHGGVLRKSSC
jgi:hypothetical protein